MFAPVKFYGRKHLCQTNRKRGIRIKISARWGRGGKSESAKGDKCKGEKTHKACRDTSYNTVALSKSVRPPREVDPHFLTGGARSARPPREADRRFLGEGGLPSSSSDNGAGELQTNKRAMRPGFTQ